MGHRFLRFVLAGSLSMGGAAELVLAWWRRLSRFRPMAGAVKTGRVFVSHTSDMAQVPEGRSYVQAALDAVGRAEMTPVDMRYFAARDVRPADYCRRRVRECEIYVAVVGFRYGSLVAGEAVSYTELEFLTASEAGLPRLVFLLEEAACPPGQGDPDRSVVAGFRRRLAEAGLIVRAFTTSDGLELEVFHALSELAGETPSAGPLSGDSAALAPLSGQASGPGWHRGSGVPGCPGGVPLIWNVPNRNAGFTGRAAVLRRLHEDLSADGRTVVLARALHGLGGVGKTQVALEYAHRFKADYDLIWWIPAEQPQAISSALADLAARLGLQAGDDAADAAAAALEYLRRGAAGRWLFIFDNAEDPADLEPFLPAGPGHVIVTSRNHAWTHHAQPVELDVFTEDESVAHLTRHVPGLAAGDAARIAAAAGDLPLAIAQAAAWLSETGMPAALYIERLETSAVSALGLGESFGYATPVVATWDLSFGRLRARSPAAVRLLQTLAFCSPEPISMTLLYGDELIASLLPFDGAMQDRLMLGQVIRNIARLALVRVDQAGQSLQIHRLVQAVIRSQMTTEQQLDARHTVHQMLAGARPQRGEADDPARWTAYDTIWPHLISSLAEECDDERTRELLIDWVYYQRIRGEHESALVLARRLQRLWTSQLGADHEQTLRLQAQLAGVLLHQGRFTEALELGTLVLGRQRDVLGPDHPDTLMTASGLAGCYRGLGEYQLALTSDQRTYASRKEQHGEEDRRTLAAANNLAVSLRLTGDYSAARRIDQETLRRRRIVLYSDHPNALHSAFTLAEDMRAEGDFRESAELLHETWNRFRAVLGDDALQTLRCANGLAISLRKSGALDEAMRLARDTHERYLRRHDRAVPDALRCTLNLAAAHAAVGENDRARELAAKARAACAASLGGGHPNTLAAANNLAIYLRCTGDLPQALQLAEHTLAKLRGTLGDEHPFSLVSAVNLAACLGDAEDLPRAGSLQRNALRDFQKKLGPRHPDTLACQAGLAVTLHRAGQDEEAEHVRARILEVLAYVDDNHPDITLLRDWRYISRDLDAPPV